MICLQIPDRQQQLQTMTLTLWSPGPSDHRELALAERKVQHQRSPSLTLMSQMRGGKANHGAALWERNSHQLQCLQRPWVTVTHALCLSMFHRSKTGEMEWQWGTGLPMTVQTKKHTVRGWFLVCQFLRMMQTEKQVRFDRLPTSYSGVDR